MRKDDTSIVTINPESFGYIGLKSKEPYTLEELQKVISKAWTATKILGELDMTLEQRKHYDNNKNTLKKLYDEVGLGGTYDFGKTLAEGCYVATMVYGSYDHPQVMILRQFRDEVLDKSYIGKWLIKTYYYYSPKIVEKLKDKSFINKVIRLILNQFIKTIK